MPDFSDLSRILTALVLVLVNGFFVAAEFALVKIRISRIEQMVLQGKLFAKTAKWLAQRLEHSLSACQLGITMASLALGAIGEPAVAHLLSPLLSRLGLGSEAILHAVSFAISFTVVTALHLVIGEQAPKVFAIRNPEPMLLTCALPLKIFYILTYPLMFILSVSTDAPRDLKLEIADDQLGALVGTDAIRRMLDLGEQQLQALGADPAGVRATFKLRRRAAMEGTHNEVVPFHRDSSLVVVNVALNDDFDGGHLLFALDGRIVCPTRLAGSATAHDCRIVHAVSCLTAGIRYNLYAVYERPGTAAAA